MCLFNWCVHVCVWCPVFHDSDTVTGRFPWPLPPFHTDECCRSLILCTHTRTHASNMEIGRWLTFVGEDMAFSPYFYRPITLSERGGREIRPFVWPDNVLLILPRESIHRVNAQRRCVCGCVCQCVGFIPPL